MEHIGHRVVAAARRQTTSRRHGWRRPRHMNAPVRTLLRSAEGREATYSSVAFGGWLVVVAGLSQMVMWNWGLINGAADASDDSAVQTLGYVAYFGWAGMGIGLAAAFLAMGLGGIRNPGIPPGGLVTYVLLPFWLIAASVVIARSTNRAPDPTRQALVTVQEPG